MLHNGALDGGDDLKQLLNDIFVSGSEPIFCLRVFEGTYQPIEGFQFGRGQRLPEPTDVFSNLRVEGDYPLGICDYNSPDLAVSMQISFRTCECDECVEE